MSVQQESYKSHSESKQEGSWKTEQHDPDHIELELHTPDKDRSRSASPPHSQVTDMTGAAAEPLGKTVWDGALGASGRNPDAYVRDLRMALSPIPHVKPHWQDRYMKILVVGESGLGKTTFIRNLFAAYAQDPHLKVNDASTRTCLETFRLTPDKLCTEIVVEDKHRLTRYIYQVQDSPGWENLADSLDPVLNYINDANLKMLQYEQDARRDAPLTAIPDPRVDVCFYFVAPHRIKDGDVQSITQISELVPVIPILAKADCMTSPELAEFRKLVRSRLSSASREAGRELVLKFPKKQLQEAGARPDLPPFAVIASNTMDQSVGRFWPVRQYPWGTCEAHSSEHSDVATLKKLLFEVSYEELKDATEERYYSFRERELLNADNPDMNAGRGIQPRFILNKKRRERGPLPQRVLKTVVSLAVVYFSGALIIGGKERLHADAKVVGTQIKEVASTAGEKAKDVAEVAKDKALEAKDYVVDVVNPPPPPKKKGLFGWGTPIF